ncbi:DUF3298 domain-containing protein [Peptacetobacter sp. AB845]|uniref:DUF3298 domain-containing protein n=1 Tax=Peptacetobacter sp. AB845 TaxID=3388429 RepID=UPI0039C90657
MKNDKIDKLKENYNNIEIPKELDDVINDAFKESEDKKIENNKKDWRRNMKNMKKWYASAAAVGLIIVSVNASSTFATSLENIPVIGNIIKIVNFNNYRINKDGMDVSISLPEVSSDSKDLEYKLNKEFEKEGKEAYKKYEAEVAKLEKEGKTTHKSAEVWSETIAENDKTASIAIYNTEIEASAATSRKIYNINKENKTVLTLEGMFGNNDYVDVLSKNILSQMKERTKKDSNDVYFVDNTFKIKKDQPFYINDKGELVICFDEYEVAPGSAGLVEFVIPSNIVSKLMK